MKKFKGIAMLSFCCLFAGIIAFSACSSCSSCSDENEDDSSGGTSSTTDTTQYDTMLDSISVNSSGAKTSYTVGETFSSDGLVVTATTSVNFITSTSTVTGYTVDSGEFDSSKVGTYTIYVSYSLPDTQAEKYATYTVKVYSQLPYFCNIGLEYSGSTSVDWVDGGVILDITETNTLTVTQYTGDESDDLTEEVLTDYDLYYSINGGEKIELTSSTISATEQGTYSVYAEAIYSVGKEDHKMEGRVDIQVGSIEEDPTSYGLANSDITSSDEYSAGKEITSNDLFTLVSTVATQYGAASGMGSFTDVDGNTVTPSQGLKNSSAVATSTSCDVYTITALANCKVTVHVSVSNDSFNSQRSATVYYKLNGAQTTAQSVTKRTEIVEITLELSKDDKLVIGFENGTSGTAKLYLWSALAPVTSDVA